MLDIACLYVHDMCVCARRIVSIDLMWDMSKVSTHPLTPTHLSGWHMKNAVHGREKMWANHWHSTRHISTAGIDSEARMGFALPPPHPPNTTTATTTSSSHLVRPGFFRIFLLFHADIRACVLVPCAEVYIGMSYIAGNFLLYMVHAHNTDSTKRHNGREPD